MESEETKGSEGLAVPGEEMRASVGKHDQEVIDFWTCLSLLEEKVQSGNLTDTEFLREVDAIRPRTPLGKEVCPECCCLSMRHIVTAQPGREEESTMLACEICGCEDLSIPE